MSQIRGKNTKPEILVRKYLFSHGFRYRLHDKHLPGKPDIVLAKYKTVIFIHGCFWHAHADCKFARIPGSNTAYWLPKLEKNRAKDLIYTEQLQQAGWRVIIVWECELKGEKAAITLASLISNIAEGTSAGNGIRTIDQ